MFTRRIYLQLPAIAAAIAVSSMPVAAGSTSTPLSVSVTVVRSCAVRTTSVQPGSAQLDLTCANGGATGLRVRPTGRQQKSGTLQMRMRTSPFRGGTAESGVEVVTLDF